MIYLATSKPHRSGVIPSWAPRNNRERLAEYVLKRAQIESDAAMAEARELVRSILAGDSPTNNCE